MPKDVGSHKQIWRAPEDWEPLAGQYDKILAEGRRHSKPYKLLPPLPEGSIAVQGVMEVPRAIATGEAIPLIISPNRWSKLYHSVGRFEAK